MKPDIAPLDGDLDALLDAERHAPPPSPGAAARVEGRLRGALGLPPALPSAASPPSAPSLFGRSFAAKLALLAVGATVASVGVVAGLRATSTRPPAAAVDRAPTAPVATAAVASPIAPASTAAAPALPADAPAPAARPLPRTAGDLDAEHRLLAAAQGDLRAGDPSACLARLDGHARRFPQGQLAEERESLRVRALAAAGRSDEARDRAERFRRRYPSSLFLPAIEATLAGR